MPKVRTEAIRSALALYFIMGSVDCRGRDPEAVLAEAVSSGVTMFQYREKGPMALSGSARLGLGRRLQAICQAQHIPFIVNDDLELAIALEADGIHVGQDDEPASVIRKRLGADKIVGVSAHTVEEAWKAVQDGADYLGIGPIFPTSSKNDAKEAGGTRLLEELRTLALPIPLVGIGGITIANASSVLDAGADGISLISAIAAAQSISEAAASFAKLVHK